ncbi:X-ray repair cross-complementing protein 5 [Hypsibius exemplaris]|uniref:X-ray repair cross-complementing protein 5 n=1 Tax=Hypsibius exemplaris TaxID=2072580 RepID=A0A1W0XBT4_HYPEX|nr:X-ray repair cross-complementing protein 5 [Hypsibius exemplaris]
MASPKEATVIVLDVGVNSDEPIADGVKTTALEASIKCISRMLQSKLFTESKDEFALVLVGAEDTQNRLNEMAEDSYLNIKMESDLKLVNWQILDSLAELKRATSHRGDVFEGLKVAVDIIQFDEESSKKKRFAKRRVILFSNLHGTLNASSSQISAFAKTIHACGINMVQLIGVDLEEAKESALIQPKSSKASKGKSVSPAAAISELFASLEALSDDKVLESVESYSFRDAMSYANYFASRQVRPTPWNGCLELGETLKVPVVIYARVKESKLKQTWKKSVIGDSTKEFKDVISYFVQDGLVRQEVPKEEIGDAYRYGTTLVPYSAEDKAEMKFTGTGKCLKVVGFALASKVKPHLYVGDDVKIVTAPMLDDSAQTAVSALAHALHEEKMVIICKYGYNKSSSPKLVSLSPHLCERANGAFEGFYMHFLPFEDDLRLYTFAPLLDGKAKDTYQPNDEELAAVGDLIDQLTVSKDDDDGYFDQLNPKNVRNPYLQRLFNSLQYRAVHPNDSLPELDPNVLSQMTMPAELAIRSEAARDKVKKVFELKKIEKPKFKKNLIADGTEPSTEGVDGLTDQMETLVTANVLGIDNTVSKVGTVSPVEDFTALTTGADDHTFEKAIQMAINVAKDLIYSFDGQVYADKVLRLISVMRERSVERNSPTTFNQYLKTFKAEVLENKLDIVWSKLVERKITLIQQEEAKTSSVTKAEAREFLTTTKVEKIITQQNGTKKVDDDDMIDEMFG